MFPSAAAFRAVRTLRVILMIEFW